LKYDTNILQDNFKVNDFVRFLKEKKTFDKKGKLLNIAYKGLFHFLNVHQIVEKEGVQGFCNVNVRVSYEL